VSFRGAVTADVAELKTATTLFWDFVQRARLLSDAPRLSPREREALRLIVRGFALAEIAEPQQEAESGPRPLGQVLARLGDSA
jgi:DNA-binding NarL/FixJ family response regulator